MPETDLSALKTRVDLVSVVKSSGVELVRVGKEYKGLCPFHPEKTPSFHVNPDKGLYHCFGCGASGDVLDYLQKREGLDFNTALERLRSLASVNGHERFNGKRSSAPAKVEEEQTSPLLDGRIQKAVKDVFAHYETLLSKTPEATEYLLSRGLRGVDVTKIFPMGYCDGKLPSLLPSVESPEGSEVRAALSSAGILNDRGREHFAGCVVFAIRDENDVIRQIYGRRVKEGRGPKHLYLPGPHDTFFNPLALRQDSLILTEGLLDALSFFIQGMRNVSFAYGTNGLTPPLLDALRDSNVRRVILAFDADKGGREARERIAGLLCGIGLEVLLVELPEGSDPNALHVKGESLSPFVEAAQRVECPSGPVEESEAGEGRMDIRGERIHFTFGDRSYEVDGMTKNRSPGALTVTIHGIFEKDLFADRIEIYSAKDRERFIRACSDHSGVSGDVIRLDLSRMHGKLRERQDVLLREAEKPKRDRVVPEMSESEKEAALSLLGSPGLMDTITEHFRASGFVGEETNLLSGYIAATSRLLPKPLHVLYQSSTAAGKTTLMKAVVAMMPPEAVFGYASISPKALQYMQDRDLRNSIFLLEEDRRLDEAAREMIKLLKSEGRAANAVTIKDPETGMMRAVDFVVDGPMNFQMTTTALAMDEEQSNRDLVCSADESKEQTERILAMQRTLCTLEGKAILSRREELRKLHRNAQRLLRPLSVINPYANYLTFPKHAHRLRRDHEKYIGLIEAVTLLHQYQREIKTRKLEDGGEEEYIETTLEDIKIANRIAAALLGQSLDDCPPHTRMFLDSVMALVDAEAKSREIERDMVRLTASELARHTGLSVQMVRRHLSRLMDLELVYSDEGEKKSPFRKYAFVHRVSGESHFLAGLLDTDELVRRGLDQPSEQG